MNMSSEMSRMSFEPTKDSVDRTMNLDKKSLDTKQGLFSEPIYEDELIKN